MKSDYLFFFTSLLIIQLFLINYLLRLYIKLSPKHKIISHPTQRSLHGEAITTGGGLVFAFVHIILLLISIFGIKNHSINIAIIKICTGGALILILGYFDDKYTLKPITKLTSQIIITSLIVMLGYKITLLTNPFGEAFTLGYFAVPITILWYIFVMNAMNLIDGLDGLACGISIISFIILLIYSYYSKNFFVFINSIYMIIGLSIFLTYNFPKAKLFMGDSGSLFIGYILASLSIAGNEVQFKGLTTFTLVVPATVLFIPIFDTIFTIIRRFINKQPIFMADKKHLHHKLLEFGISKVVVVLICWLMTLILGLLALGYMVANKTVMVFVLFIVFFIMTCLFFYIYKKEMFK
jgi:UDP-GlcNAc:undecaprenyl-phosphate GlcNAc-1-phosphate transferase